MGYIKEPKGVDILIQSESLTDDDRQEISKYIQKYKSDAAKKKPVKTKESTERQLNKIAR